MNIKTRWVWNVQQGSSNTLHVTDETAWYVYYEVWRGPLLLDTGIHSRHLTRAEALAALYKATDVPLNEHPLHVTPEHLGGDATWDDAARMAALLRARGWDVRLEPAPRPHPWDEEFVVTVEDWDAAWRECLAAL